MVFHLLFHEEIFEATKGELLIEAGKKTAEYGKALIEKLSEDLTAQFGRGFSRPNLEYMRRFSSLWPIPQTLSGISTTLSDKRHIADMRQLVETCSEQSSAQSFITSKIFCLNLAVTLPSSADRKGYESVTSGTESISFFITDDCAVSLSSISRSAGSLMPTSGRFIFT